ncbi:MAG: CRTAC1 family protein [Acidobacteriota bacterium]
MLRTAKSLLGAMALLLAPAGGPEGSGSRAGREEPIEFVNVAEQAGIDFFHSFGDAHFSNLVEAVGGGNAWLDFDQDGFIDLYVVTGKFTDGVSKGDQPRREPANRLYRNRGDGTFEDVTRRARLAAEGRFSLGVSVGDYDNDGYPDVYLCNYGPNVLYHNDGDGRFTDVTRGANVGNPGCSVSATWLDYDRDGLLDLYVGNYIEFDPAYNLFYAPDGFPGPLSYAGQPDALYRNRGDGTFENVTKSLAVARAGRAMSVAAADYDGDGFDDIYVTNDAMENHLLHNEGGQRFREVALEAGVAFNGMADQTASMAVDFGDYDGNGLLDIFVSDNSLSSLYRNDGKGLFSDVTLQTGIARTSAQFVGWGAFFFDFDNDGDLDIFKVNSDLSRLFGQEDQVLENVSGGKFRDVSDKLGAYFRRELMGRGASFCDYDNDGDLDVFIVNLNSGAVLLRNDGGNRNPWLSLRLRGHKSNRDGVGAKVKLVSGSRTQIAQKKSSAGYLSQNDPRLHFGLGTGNSVERIEVVWPSGELQVLEDVATGQVVTVDEPRD